MMACGSQGWAKTTPVPIEELTLVAEHIRACPAYQSPRRVAELFRPLVASVHPDPFDDSVVKSVVSALQGGAPFSAIRLGDGEGNLLSFDVYTGTPVLDRTAVQEILTMQQDTFVPNDASVIMVREMLIGSILQADVVGVSGLWDAVERDNEWLIKALHFTPRGVSGHWRAIDCMVKLAQTGSLQSKTIASAKFYFGVIERLSEIFPHAQRILLITNRVRLKDTLQNLFPDTPLDLIEVGMEQSRPQSDIPSFLAEVHRQLPRDMRGYCALIGAGPWAEIYCSWVKQRGGAALDIGSGLDLLDGNVTRPVHVAVGLRESNRYAI